MQQLAEEQRKHIIIKKVLPTQRLIFIDHLRWMMIIFVVLVHAAVTYSSIGGWYYYETRELDLLSFGVFAVFISFTQAYFMGFLFLIAGYFIPASYKRKGLWRFIQDRMIRLGIPILIYMFVITPFIGWFLLGSFSGDVPLASFPHSYTDYIRSLFFVRATGPLWFALALLLFSAVYAFIKKGFSVKKEEEKTALPGHKQVIGIILFIAFFTFNIRLVQPIGTEVLNMQLCFFTQYIVLFSVGIMAYHKKWFLRIPYKFGVAWFKAGLLIGLPMWLGMMILGGGLSGNEEIFFGGFYWQSALYAIWESFFCICMCLGLIVIFREKYNKHSRWSQFLSDNAFGVYVFHAPILIYISLLIKDWMGHPLLKFLTASVFTLLASFLLSSLIRRNKLMRKIFS